MFDSDKLFYAYCVGAAITVVLGLWLSARNKIDTPVFLTIVTSHEFALLMFAVFWPVLGPAVLLEIVLRGWVRRRAREKASKIKVATATKPLDMR
jgi:hypothetical protein